MTIAVVGAGVMGSGTALDLAIKGFDVLVKDIDSTALARSQEMIKADFRMVKMVAKDLGDLKIQEVLAHIKFQETYENFDRVDMVIENISEDIDKKKSEYQRLAISCNENIIFAINTSCISITQLAAHLPRPDRVIGTHFMNPVPLKKMVEVIRGHHTSDTTVEEIKQLLKQLGKKAVVVNDYPGFVSNRLSHLFMNEAAFIVQDNVASPEQVDQIFKQGYGHQMGPLETADLIGLDTVVNSLRVLYESYQDSKFRVCPLLKKMVEAGLLGRKSGQGFYKY